MAGTTVGEFVLSLTVDAAKGEITLGNLITRMGALEVASIGEVAVLFKLAQALNSITQNAINTALNIRDVALATGMSTEHLQKWESAATHTRGGIKALDDAMVHAHQAIWNMTHIPLTGGSDLIQLKNLFPGLDITGLKEKEPEVLLQRLRKVIAQSKLEGEDVQARLEKAGFGGIGELLRSSDKDFEAWSKERLIMSDEEISNYKKIHDQMITIQNLASKIGDIIAGWFTGAVLGGQNALISLLKKQYADMKQASKTGPLELGETEESRKEAGFRAAWRSVNPLKSLILESIENHPPVTPASQDIGNLIQSLINKLDEIAKPKQHIYNMPVNIHGYTVGKNEIKQIMSDHLQDIIQVTAANRNPRGLTA